MVPAHILLCFYDICLRLVYPMLSVYLDYPFLIAPSIFSNVYLSNRNYLPFAINWVYSRLVFFWRGPRCFSVRFPYLFCCCCCFVCLYSVSCSQCCLRLWINCPYLTTPSIFSKCCLTRSTPKHNWKKRKKIFRLKEN